MTTLREAAQQALEALESAVEYDYHGTPLTETHAGFNDAANALRAALAEPVQEPRTIRMERVDRSTSQHWWSEAARIRMPSPELYAAGDTVLCWVNEGDMVRAAQPKAEPVQEPMPTRDDIIRMALEANILEPIDLLENNQWRQDTIRELERFAALVAAAERDKYEAKFKQLEAIMQEREQQPNKPCCLAEREKCAQLVETYEKAGNTMNAPEYVMVFKDCAAAIRARKDKQ